jgi:hypothetical protein
MEDGREFEAIELDYERQRMRKREREGGGSRSRLKPREREKSWRGGELGATRTVEGLNDGGTCK